VLVSVAFHSSWFVGRLAGFHAFIPFGGMAWHGVAIVYSAVCKMAAGVGMDMVTYLGVELGIPSHYIARGGFTENIRYLCKAILSCPVQFIHLLVAALH